MLKSSNLDSIINEIGDDGAKMVAATDETSEIADKLSNVMVNVSPTGLAVPLPIKNNQQNNNIDTVIFAANAQQLNEDGEGNVVNTSLAVQQLSAGLLQVAEPPLARARAHLKELIGKQNKIYIDLSKEKFKLDCSEVAKLNEMMNDVKLYKDKLYKIKKQMQSIYQRTKDLKKRAANIEASKQREYQRKIEKQHHEESLIGRRQQM